MKNTLKGSRLEFGNKRQIEMIRKMENILANGMGPVVWWIGDSWSCDPPDPPRPDGSTRWFAVFRFRCPLCDGKVANEEVHSGFRVSRPSAGIMARRLAGREYTCRECELHFHVNSKLNLIVTKS